MEEATFEDLAFPHHPRGEPAKPAGRRCLSTRGIKGCGFLICTDILEMQGAFMRSFESAEGDGEGMALKI